MTAICVIPARGGSVRIQKKNIRLFHGKPIIAYSIECAQKSGVFNKIIVSTDDHEIAVVAERYGAKVWWRPRDDGTKGTQEVVADVLRETSSPHGYACCLYATAPMLKPETLRMALDELQKPMVSYVVPVGNWLEDPGQFYFGVAKAFGSIQLLGQSTRLLPVDPNTCCDINTEEDWKIAEQMFLRSKHGNSGVLEG